MEYMEQQMQNYIEAGISEADRCYARIAELEKQNAELAATVEAFDTLIHEGINGESAEPIATDGQITGYAISYEWLEKVGDALSFAGKYAEQILKHSEVAANHYAEYFRQEKK